MKYQISCIGKSENKTEKLLIDKYLKRIGPKLKIKELNLKKFNTFTEIEKQGEELIKIFPQNSVLFLLDKDGFSFSTEKLAEIIKQYEMSNIKLINFVIGGPYGHGENIKLKAKHIISFGKMTWSHLLTRKLIVEQLYRIETIFKNHPYHK